MNIYPDNPFVIPGNSAMQMDESLRCYSTVFTFSKSLVPVFYQLGAKHVEWLPFGFDPATHSPAPPTSGELPPFDVAYLGAWGPIQERWLSPLVELGLRIFGPGWHHLASSSPLRACWEKGAGMGRHMASAISGAKITVNLTRAEHGCGHSMKTFEIPACGGFMLTNRTDEQMQFFADEKECVYFDTIDEMFVKAKYYVENADQRERIRLAGIKAVRGHAYENRAIALLKHMGTAVPSLHGPGASIL